MTEFSSCLSSPNFKLKIWSKSAPLTKLIAALQRKRTPVSLGCTKWVSAFKRFFFFIYLFIYFLASVLKKIIVSSFEMLFDEIESFHHVPTFGKAHVFCWVISPKLLKTKRKANLTSSSANLTKQVSTPQTPSNKQRSLLKESNKHNATFELGEESDLSDQQFVSGRHLVDKATTVHFHQATNVAQFTLANLLAELAMLFSRSQINCMIFSGYSKRAAKTRLGDTKPGSFFTFRSATVLLSFAGSKDSPSFSIRVGKRLGGF